MARRSGWCYCGILAGVVGCIPFPNGFEHLVRAEQSGLVVSYKYRLATSAGPTVAAVAVMGGMGIVNLGNHAYLDVALLASARQATFTPYGGLRASQVLPPAARYS